MEKNTEFREWNEGKEKKLFEQTTTKNFFLSDCYMRTLNYQDKQPCFSKSTEKGLHFPFFSIFQILLPSALSKEADTNYLSTSLSPHPFFCQFWKASPTSSSSWTQFHLFPSPAISCLLAQNPSDKPTEEKPYRRQWKETRKESKPLTSSSGSAEPQPARRRSEEEKDSCF